MGRNSESSKRSSMCEKILKAFGVYPKIVKFSQDDQEPNYKPYSQPIHVHVHAAPEMEKKQKPANNVNNSHIGGETTKEKLAHKISGSGGGGGGGEDVNDVFSDYINRAKRRLVNSISSKRSSQSHDSSGSSRGKENAKDDRRFSDYIIRARNKLKATASSNVGWSRGSSIK